MVINISVQYTGTRLNTMWWLCIYSLCTSILLLPCVMVYYIVSVLFLLFFWCPCMAIKASVQFFFILFLYLCTLFWVSL